MLLLSEFLQPLVNASKFFSYTGLLSNEAPILFVEAAQFFHLIDFFFSLSLSLSLSLSVMKIFIRRSVAGGPHISFPDSR